jgi:hypothetical protein
MGRLEMPIRMAFFPFWRIAMKWGSLSLMLAFGAITVTGEQVPELVLVEALVPFVVGMMASIVRFFPVAFLTPDGLRCPDRWGRFRLLKWELIDDVRPVNWLGYRYLGLRASDKGRLYWLPHALVNFADFAKAVAVLAGADHPLTQALAREV